MSGELAVQAESSGQLSVIDGGISFKASLLGDSSIQLANAELQYERAGDEWSGSAVLGFAKLVELNVNGVISDGKLDELTADFSCSTSKICGTGTFPTLGAILDIKDIDLSMINLQGIDYTPPPTIGSFQLPIVCARATPGLPATRAGAAGRWGSHRWDIRRPHHRGRRL